MMCSIFIIYGEYMAEDVARLLCTPFYGKDASNMDCSMDVYI